MKILHILDHSLPLHSGYTFRSRSIFNAQRQCGLQPVVVTSPKHEENWQRDTVENEVIDGTTYYRSGACTVSSWPFIHELEMMRSTFKRIMQVAASEQPNLLHAHSPVLNAISALRAGRKLGIPVVYEIRAFWEDAAVDHGTYAENSWKYRLIKYLETWVCRRVDHIAILCNGLKNDLMSRGIPAEKITPVFNGVNLEDFKETEPDREFQDKWDLRGKKVLGFIGSFYRYEGLDLLIDAYAHVVQSCPNTVLLLVGGGEVADELKEKVRQLDLEKYVIMPGRIDHHKIPAIYTLIDVLAYPRRSMRLTELVTPLKPLEAMAMGKALVASDVGGHKELIDDRRTGILFEAGNVNDLANALTRLLVNDVCREDLQRQALQWVQENQTWEMTTQSYRDVYDNLVKTARRNELRMGKSKRKVFTS